MLFWGRQGYCEELNRKNFPQTTLDSGATLETAIKRGKLLKDEECEYQLLEILEHNISGSRYLRKDEKSEFERIESLFSGSKSEDGSELYPNHFSFTRFPHIGKAEVEIFEGEDAYRAYKEIMNGKILVSANDIGNYQSDNPDPLHYSPANFTENYDYNPKKELIQKIRDGEIEPPFPVLL